VTIAPPAGPPPPISAPASNSSFFGVNAHFVYDNSAFQEKSIEYMEQAGVGSVRFDIPWNFMESIQPPIADELAPVASDFSSSELGNVDSAVSLLNAAGIKVQIVMTGTPTWANGGSSDTSTPPSNPQEFAAVMAFFAQRYGSGVQAWEVWNEPTYSWAGGPNPQAYTTLLKDSYIAIKNVDPAAIVLGGSLSNVQSSATCGPSCGAQFLESMFQDGAAQYMSALSVHGYVYPLNSGGPDTIFTQFHNNILPVIKEYDSNLPIWFTETGYTTGGGSSDAVTEQQQAQYLTQAYQDAEAQPLVRLNYYELTNDRATTNSQGQVVDSNAQDFFGMIDPFPDGSNGTSTWRLKPAFYAFQALAK
jgi:hypothetical protein